jgi:hypothetical protein
VGRTGELGTSVITSNRYKPRINTTVLYYYTIAFLPALLITANVVPGSPILATLVMEAIRSSETSVLTRVAVRNIREDDVLFLSLSLLLRR